MQRRIYVFGDREDIIVFKLNGLFFLFTTSSSVPHHKSVGSGQAVLGKMSSTASATVSPSLCVHVGFFFFQKKKKRKTRLIIIAIRQSHAKLVFYNAALNGQLPLQYVPRGGFVLAFRQTGSNFPMFLTEKQRECGRFSPSARIVYSISTFIHTYGMYIITKVRKLYAFA